MSSLSTYPILISLPYDAFEKCSFCGANVTVTCLFSLCRNIELLVSVDLSSKLLIRPLSSSSSKCSILSPSRSVEYGLDRISPFVIQHVASFF